MCKKLDKEQEFSQEKYVKCYELIQNIVRTCYFDYFLIEFYRDQDEGIQRKLSRHRVLHHIIWLVKQDLCLNLWKICYDRDEDASSLENLFIYLRKSMIDVSYKKTKCYKRLEKPIREARHFYLAHSDVEKVTGSISIDSMKELLDESRAALNSLCLEQYGTAKYTDKMLSVQRMKIKMDAYSLVHPSEEERKLSE